MRRSGTKRKRLIAACAGSLALHALGLLLVARMSWEVVEHEPAESIPVVWLGDLRISEAAVPFDERAPPEPLPVEPEEAPPAEAPRSESEPPPEQAPAPRPEPESVPPSPPEPVPPSEPEREAAIEPEPAAEPAPTAPAEAVSPGPDAPARDPGAESYIITEAELEEAWRNALEQLERERDYRAFSLDDLVEAAPPEEPGSEESIFEAAERFRGRDRPSVLSPNNARTRVGRAFAELCNALTGGFGLGFGGMTFASVCAEPGESAKLFADIKPAYLRSRPVCTEVETGTVVPEGETPTIKCELVEQEE